MKAFEKCDTCEMPCTNDAVNQDCPVILEFARAIEEVKTKPIYKDWQSYLHHLESC